jgi:lipoprotein-anchoring transpeptidase ErfK/SrfK
MARATGCSAFPSAVLIGVFAALLPGPRDNLARGQAARGLALDMKGEDVKALQRRLNEDSPTRLPRLNTDGAYDALTAARVMEFQHQHKLTADGLVGEKTWEALNHKPTTGKAKGRAILVDLVHKELFAYEDGAEEMHVKAISGGRAGYRSTLGVFKIDKDRRYPEYTSKEFPAPPGRRNMDFAQFYHGGEALHQGDPKVESHGCIHLPAPDAEHLFDWVGKDPDDVALIVVTPERPERAAPSREESRR